MQSETDKPEIDWTKLEKYVPPVWAAELDNVPEYKAKLAITDTPVQRWKLPGVPDDLEIYIKREDMTGCSLSGNKVRKLEFLFADAIRKGYRHVLTFGNCGQSNHCRAVTIAARQLGLTPHLVITAKASEIGYEGNALLCRMAGARIITVNRRASSEEERMIASEVEQETGEPCYTIPLGGSNHIGSFGYMGMFEELRKNNLLEEFDDIVFPSGSRGTAASICLSNYLTGSQLRCHPILITKRTKENVMEHIQAAFHDAGLTNADFSESVDIIDGYLGRGYALAAPEELEFAMKVCMETGILLDPSYTGKAAFGLVKELQRNPSRFKGKRILFVHTGGIFGLFDDRINATLRKAESTWNGIKTIHLTEEKD